MPADLYRSYAAKLFDVPVERVTPEMRAVAKQRAYKHVYGNSPLPPGLEEAFKETGTTFKAPNTEAKFGKRWPPLMEREDVDTIRKHFESLGQLTEQFKPDESFTALTTGRIPCAGEPPAPLSRADHDKKLDAYLSGLLDNIINTRSASDALTAARAEFSRNPDYETAEELKFREVETNSLAQVARSALKVIIGGRE